MSTVRLQYTEYNRLRDQERRAQDEARRAEEERRRNQDLNRRMNNLRRQMETSTDTINTLTETNDNLRNQVNAANSQINAMERAHREQRAAMENRINDLNRSMREAREKEEAFQETVRDQFGAIHVAMGDLNRRLDSQSEAIRAEVRAALARQEEELNRRTRNTQERSTQTIAELRRYLEDLKPLEPERFYPGVYPVLEAQADSAESDIKNSQMESALAVAQSAVAQAAETYIRSRVMRQAFDERLEEARLVAVHARETIESQVNELRADIAVRAGSLANGCPVAAAMNPDYWNDGAFTALSGRLQEIQAQLDHMDQNTWTPADLEQEIQNMVQIENECLEERRSEDMQLERYFDALVDGIATIQEVIGDSWECIRYEHTEEGNLRSSIQMVFSDGAGHELPMILDVRPDAPAQTQLGMTVVSEEEDAEDIDTDREVILEDIRGRLIDNGMKIESSEVNYGNCSTAARSANAYFASSYAQTGGVAHD